jgi:hypothetical protein
MMNSSAFQEGKDFSIILGGPFFQLLRRIGLTGSALELMNKRAIIIALLAWLPLLVLSVINGQAWGEGTNLPFIEDLEAHIRFLVALPLMIFAERIVHERMQMIVMQFEERNLISDQAQEQFRKAIASAYRWRNSFVAEAFILVLIYVIGYSVVWNKTMALDTTAWYTEPSVGQGNLSLAGLWFRYISLPLFQFLLLRWYYRIFIWSRFLFFVSRIELRLVPTHPDGAGGLGFLSYIVYAFMPLALAHGATIAASIANHLFHEGAELLDFKFEIIIIVVVVLCLVLVPLLMFSSQLMDAKRIGTLTYGKLAARYVHEFEAKWVRANSADEELIGSKDIQSLADMANSFKIVERMQFIPITRTDIILLVLATIAPLVPLLLTMMPLSELFKLAAGVLF